ncbi:thioesterase family protein [Craterilacuibacter sp. RT1T]|uniref:acyl-CoA thioesterase n=1 Tax=Craterilacuibacter sp. RT1T TaxID=2942211 RepID=UPI0020BFE8CE|nr:thioesterase family protein [Craterilacuibacter sp. RT1T]MCL6262450.1 acyl-CoA thioesterase [Craterilacuibacter sp. RT1T]
MKDVFTWRFAVPAQAIDFNGHANNVEYLRWMQDAALKHSTHRGWGIARYLECDHSWVVRSQHIEYLRPVFADQMLALHTWIVDFEGNHSRRQYLIECTHSGKPVARGESLFVCVDTLRGRPRSISPDFIADFDTVPSEVAALKILRQRPPATV